MSEMHCRDWIRHIVAVSAVLLVAASTAFALPFNDDMVDSQIKTGQAMRPLPEGSIPVGSLSPAFFSKEQAEALTNPKKNAPGSAERGKLLFSVQCAACHGKISKTNYVMSKVQMGAPNLADALYDEDPSDGQTRTDGQIFRAIYFGNLIMPAVGWKIAPSEAWDIVNYIRQVQTE